MLTMQEKRDLYSVIAATLGDDVDIKASMLDFNDETLEVVGDAVKANMDCNLAMKQLVAKLIQGSSMLTKAWLKKVLKDFGKELANDRLRFNGYACQVGTKSRWKSAIIATTI